MAQILEMPKLSDTMTESSIVRWLKKEGDKIDSGIPVVEVETDKSNMEYESPYSGILLKILVQEGQKCALQAPIAVIGKQNENWEEALKAYKEKLGSSASNEVKQTTKTSAEVTDKPTTQTPADVINQASSSQKSVDQPHVVESQISQNNNSVKASPLAKKIASALGINLASVKGSGPNNRVIQKDVIGYQTTPSQIQSDSTQTSAVRAEVQKKPLTNMRKTIAQRLTQSVTTAPHFYLKISFNLTHLLESRKAMLAQLTADQKFSVNDLMIYFVSRALLKHPEINSSWQDDHIAEYSYVDMSVAVALPQGGLVTPVIRNAHVLNIFEIAQESTRLIALARSSKLQPSDYSGGTFSISNLGMSGVEDFTAIINPPQAAILAIGSAIPTPVVSHTGQVVVEQRMTVSLSCDHRVIDGYMGAKFLQTLKYYIENPVALLLTK